MFAFFCFRIPFNSHTFTSSFTSCLSARSAHANVQSGFPHGWQTFLQAMISCLPSSPPLALMPISSSTSSESFQRMKLEARKDFDEAFPKDWSRCVFDSKRQHCIRPTCEELRFRTQSTAPVNKIPSSSKAAQGFSQPQRTLSAVLLRIACNYALINIHM